MARVDSPEATIQGIQQITKFSSSFRHLGESFRSVLTSTKSIWIIGLGSARDDPQVAIIEAENNRYKEMQGMMGDMKQFKVNTKKKTQIKKVFLINKFKTGKQEQDEKASNQDVLQISGSQTFQVGGVLQPVLQCHSQHL